MELEYPTEVAPYLVGRRMNLGCGGTKMTGFVNVDMYGDPDIKFDAKEPWPVPTGSYDAVWAHHMLEHFTGDEALKVFWEIGKALKTGGHLVAATPYGTSELQYSCPFRSSHLLRSGVSLT